MVTDKTLNEYEFWLVFEFLDLENLMKISQVCKLWQSIVQRLLNSKSLKANLLCRMNILSIERKITWSKRYTLKSDALMMLHEYSVIMKKINDERKYQQMKKSIVSFLQILHTFNILLTPNKNLVHKN